MTKFCTIYNKILTKKENDFLANYMLNTNKSYELPNI